MRPVFLNSRSALRLACFCAFTKILIQGAAGRTVVNLVLIGANLSKTALNQLKSENDVIEFLILFNESVSDDLKDDMSIDLIFLLLTVLETGFGFEKGKGTVKTK